MKLRSFSIEDLIAAGNAAVYVFKDKLGYDNANFEGININDYNVSLEFDLTDDFQNNLVSGEKYMAGYYVKISLDEGDPCQVFYNRLHSWPTRAQRELHIMASQLSKVGESCEGMVSMQVAAFVEQIKDAQSKLARLQDLR